MCTENGQFQTNDDSIGPNGNISLLYNPYSWSKIANVIYLEQPKGVGFSYCADGVACVNTDESVGEEAADFLEEWFKGFSEYAQSDFYITGTSRSLLCFVVFLVYLCLVLASPDMLCVYVHR